jgi:hypothetical protein
VRLEHRGDAIPRVFQFPHPVLAGVARTLKWLGSHVVDALDDSLLLERHEKSDEKLEGQAGAVGDVAAGPLHGPGDVVDEGSEGDGARAYHPGTLRHEPGRCQSAASRGKVRGMGGNVVNLNRFRKKKERAEKAKQAEINRIRHGRTKGEKQREHADRERAARLLDGKRLEPPSEATGPASSSEEPDEP